MTKEIYKYVLQHVVLPYDKDNISLIWKYQQDNPTV